MNINRRDFIKTGGMVMLGTLAAPSLLGSCTGSEGDKAAGISFAMNYFKVSEGGFEEGIGGSLGERRGLCRFVF